MLGLLFLVGCTNPNRPSPTTAATRLVPGHFGDCTAPIDLRLEADGRKARLLSEVTYIDPAGVTWLAPKDWVIDGASIPRPFWSIIGAPWEGKYRFASVVHDVACDQKQRRWDDAARMFYQAMRCSGVQESKAKVMYFAVYKFGPHWPSPGAPKFRGGPPRPPTDEDVRRVRQFVDKANPTLEQIEAEAMKP